MNRKVGFDVKCSRELALKLEAVEIVPPFPIPAADRLGYKSGALAWYRGHLWWVMDAEKVNEF